MKKDYAYCGNTFIIDNYADKSPFTSFLPGIAGLKGRPLWAFYVNRGQGLAGFGVKSKDNAIMEFFPAEIAYGDAPLKGFRTFLKIDGRYAEPFAVNGRYPTRMKIAPSSFSIEERAKSYSYRAEYFGVPNRSYAALARIASYTNETEKVQRVAILDGLSRVIPFGLSNAEFKEAGNLFKSWMCVEGTDQGFAFYKMRSSTADSSEVTKIEGGYFYAFASSFGTFSPVVDPKCVFGGDKTLSRAVVFEKQGLSAHGNTENEFACAFAGGEVEIAPHETLTLVSLTGYADAICDAAKIHERLTVEEVIALREEAAAEAEKISAPVRSHTAYPLFDEYIRSCQLDNVLRGGMPVCLGGKTYYVFSRKHGDPERDYNSFALEPQPYSCGNGNFRDVAQNRRSDALIYPECGDFNVKYFFSLLQTDGYNPLSVLGVQYRLTDIPEDLKARETFFRRGFTVGELAGELKTADEAALAGIVESAETEYKAAFGEGYWTDHFVYLIDLVTSYLAVYPDRAEALLYETPLDWFKSGARILPRDGKTVMRQDGEIRRYGSVVKTGADGWTETVSGKRYKTSLAAKLLFLITIKLATLDPYGCGIDMEADKPGWCDATNGLPAVFGSNVADAIELLRLIDITAELFKNSRGKIEWCEEQNLFYNRILALLEQASSPLEFYEKSNDYKEEYRAAAIGTVSDNLVTVERISTFLKLAKSRLREGLDRAKALGEGWYPTYLRFEVTKYERICKNGEQQYSAGGLPLVRAKAFQAHPLPHFAEGVAKGLTIGEKALYDEIAKSSMHDKVLGLYLTSEPLDGESMEIGRIRSFPKGWLERESCFLHMNYKLMLSLLSAGLYGAFFQEIRKNFVPFMKPQVYGRSILENSSFLVTSNHVDGGKWGKGYQARLTGANSEVLSIWRVLMGIEKPFSVIDGELAFELKPVLSKDFFDKNDEASFLFLGRTEIVYHNPNKKNTYAKNVRPVRYRLIGADTDVTVEKVVGPFAEKVRSGEITKIEVEIL